MTVTLVQSNRPAPTVGSTITADIASAPAAGDVVVALIQSGDATARTVSSVSGLPGCTWVRGYGQAVAGQRQEVWIGTGATSYGTVTATMSASGSTSLSLWVVRGLTSTTVTGGEQHGTGSSTATGPTLNAQSGTFVLEGAVGVSSTSTQLTTGWNLVPTTGWSIPANVSNSGAAPAYGFAYRIPTEGTATSHRADYYTPITTDRGSTMVVIGGAVAAQTVNVGRATVTSTARPLGAGRTFPVGRATETDTARTVRSSVLVSAARAIATSLARAVTPVFGPISASVGRATETDTARPMSGGNVTVPVLRATTTTIAQPLSVFQSSPQSIEVGKAVVSVDARAVYLDGKVPAPVVVIPPEPTPGEIHLIDSITIPLGPEDTISIKTRTTTTTLESNVRVCTSIPLAPAEMPVGDFNLEFTDADPATSQVITHETPVRWNVYPIGVTGDELTVTIVVLSATPRPDGTPAHLGFVLDVTNADYTLEWPFYRETLIPGPGTYVLKITLADLDPDVGVTGTPPGTDWINRAMKIAEQDRNTRISLAIPWFYGDTVEVGDIDVKVCGTKPRSLAVKGA